MAIGALQRLPYLLVGSTLLLVPDPGDTVLTLVVLAPLMSGLAGGVSVTAWREYIAKSIPAHRRASLWATRFVLGGGSGSSPVSSSASSWIDMARRGVWPAAPRGLRAHDSVVWSIRIDA